MTFVRSELPMPAAAVAVSQIAHAAVESRPIVETSGIEAVEVLVKYREEAAEMGLSSGGIAVDLDLGDLGLDEAADLQPAFQPMGYLPEQVGVGGELDFVDRLHRLAGA